MLLAPVAGLLEKDKVLDGGVDRLVGLRIEILVGHPPSVPIGSRFGRRLGA
jgi:hypothetical protein